MEAQSRLDIFAEMYDHQDPNGSVLGKRPCYGFCQGNEFSGERRLAQLKQEASIPQNENQA